MKYKKVILFLLALVTSGLLFFSVQTEFFLTSTFSFPEIAGARIEMVDTSGDGKIGPGEGVTFTLAGVTAKEGTEYQWNFDYKSICYQQEDGTYECSPRWPGLTDMGAGTRTGCRENPKDNTQVICTNNWTAWTQSPTVSTGNHNFTVAGDYRIVVRQRVATSGGDYEISDIREMIVTVEDDGDRGWGDNIAVEITVPYIGAENEWSDINQSATRSRNYVCFE